MEKHYLYIIVGVLAGVVAGVLLAQNAVNNRNYPMMNMMGMHGYAREPVTIDSINDVGGMHMSMSSMTSSLENKYGDEFDREFIKLMIDHHQGAIDMASLVLQNSQRDELRNLAEEIISAQSKEIDMMRDWDRLWFK